MGHSASYRRDLPVAPDQLLAMVLALEVQIRQALRGVTFASGAITAAVPVSTAFPRWFTQAQSKSTIRRR